MKVSGKRGESVAVKLAVQIKDGYHINSDKPADEYMIPLRLTWDKAAVQADSIVFPAPRQEKYAFADKPLSVYTGGFEIVSKLRVLEPKAQDGMGLLTAKLRYQACTETMCLPPKTVDIKIPFEVR